MKIFKDANGAEKILPEGEQIYWRISAYCIVEKENKILSVIPTWNTTFELPGGGVEESESIKEGIIRECYEETGYKIKIPNNTPLYLSEENFYHQHAKKFFHSVIIVYLAELINNIQHKEVVNTFDRNEISKIDWTPITSFSTENTHRIIYPAILEYKKIINIKHNKN